VSRRIIPSIAEWGVLCGLALANVAILVTDVSWLRLGAGVAMLFVLPGLAWLPGTGWLGTRCGVERLVLLGGISAAISSAALLAAVYWPQPFNLAGTLIFLDGAVLIGWVVGLLRGREGGPGLPSSLALTPGPSPPYGIPRPEGPRDNTGRGESLLPLLPVFGGRRQSRKL
jgi:hypothetical protein